MLCDIKIHLIIKSVLFFIEVMLIYNVVLMLITAVQWSNSVIHLHIMF